MVSCLSKLSSHDLAYCHEQDIESQQPVFPAAQWSKKSSSACAMDDYVKVLYFTRVGKWFLTYASCISLLPRPMVILLNWYYLWPTLNVSIVFYMLWEDAGQQSWVPGSAHIQCFYCVLHDLRECRVTKLIPWECPHSMFLLCFTRFERMPGNKVGSLGVPTFNVSMVFYGMPGNKVDSLGVPTFNVSIVFYTLWEDAR